MASSVKTESIPAVRAPITSPTNSSAAPVKTLNHHRHHSVGSLNPSHRVTRRKSMSSNTTNIAAVAQAVKEAAEAQMAVGAAVVGSPGIGKPHQSGTGSVAITGYPSPPGSVPTPSILSTAMAANDSIQQLRKNGGTTLLNGSAIAEGHAPEVNRGARNRRSSDGAGALGGAGKMGRMRSGSELKCDKCGKGYKHSSCLTKHLWEHTPEWSYTSKLLISKHQQVQLLEAASILVSMNPTPPDSSSGASNNEGNSSANDSSSSEETTPPPSGMSLPSPVPTPRGIRNGAGKPGKRYSSGSYSRSYNSSSGGFLPGSVPTMGLSFPNHIPQRPPPRPRTGSSTSAIRGSVAPSPSLRATSNSEEDALAAAVELLSCSFNTPVIPPTIPAGSIPRGLGLSDFGSPPAGGRRFMGPLNDVVEMKMEEDEEEDEDECNSPTAMSVSNSSSPSSSTAPSRYENQKRRDWNTFGQYLKNHRPPLSLSRCSGAHVLEFLRYLDQFGKTKVHTPICPFYGHPNPPAPCPCPLRQAWGSLDALIGRLRAAFEENGGKPEANPFGARAVRLYLREVRDLQSKARGVSYEKKKRKRPPQQQIQSLPLPLPPPPGAA